MYTDLFICFAQALKTTLRRGVAPAALSMENDTQGFGYTCFEKLEEFGSLSILRQ